MLKLREAKILHVIKPLNTLVLAIILITKIINLFDKVKGQDILDLTNDF